MLIERCKSIYSRTQCRNEPLRRGRDGRNKRQRSRREQLGRKPRFLRPFPIETLHITCFTMGPVTNPPETTQDLKQIRFKSPPIVERVVTVSSDISAEQFFSRIESWKDIVAAEFPIYDPLTEWLLNIQEKDGVPLFEEAEPEVVITHRFSRRNEHGDRTWSMRCPPDRLTLNLHSERNEPHDFEELYSAMTKWLPRWSDHFGAANYPSVQLDYVNLLGRGPPLDL